MRGAAAVAFVLLAPPTGATGHDLMPAPASLSWQSGRFPIDARLRASAEHPCDDRVQAALRRTTDFLGARLGKPLPLPTVGAGKAALVVECGAAGAKVQPAEEDESYRLEVTPAGVRIAAATSLGAVWGLETLRQLVGEQDGELGVPAVTIDDRPRFPWRGLLLDAGRHFMPVETVERTLDGMAAVKLNVLHWHLSEDQGFRVESRRFPRLYQMGSDGLFYTQDQVREVIAYARERGIRVMPEFDMPGHATSWLVGHPELATLPGPYAIERRWGIFDPTLDPSREEVYTFLDGFLGEMAALFPDAHLHVGGDEVTPRHWNQSPRVRQFVYDNALQDNAALQAFFNARVNQILARHGKRMVGWDEVLHSDLPKSIVVQSWRGAESLAQAARQGYDAILSNGYYLDHIQPAAFHYAADPIPAGSTLTEAERRRIKGGEACMWAEYVSPETVESRIWPRAAAVAERLWSPADVRDAGDMYRRLAITSRRLDERGLRHRSNYEPMLRRLAGDAASMDALRALADVVEPVKGYNRGRSRVYTQQTALDRLVDAARPESDTARGFRGDVDALLLSAPVFDAVEPLRAQALAWAGNHAALDAVLAQREALFELRPLSRNLSALGRLAAEALDRIRERGTPDAGWQAEAARVLDFARVPHAEVEIAVLRGVRKLVLAAERIDRLAALTPEQWNAELEAELENKPGPPEH